MTNDVAPELLDKISKAFDNTLSGDKTASNLLNQINNGKGTYKIAGQYADRVGSALSKAFQNNLTVDNLPDGRMYWNICEKVVDPMLKENYELVADAAQTVQTSLNKSANIGIKAQKAKLDNDRIDGFNKALFNAKTFEELKRLLGDPVTTYSRSVVDDTLKDNVDFQGKSGLSPRVIRTAEANCCEWCSSIEGTYSYPNVPKDVYRRHENCKCDVEYSPGSGKSTQNVWTKQWSDSEESDKIEARKEYGLSTKVDKNVLKQLNLNADSGIVLNDDGEMVTLADINKMASPYEKAVLDSIPPKDGFFDVAAHGNANIIKDSSNGNDITARQLANIIRHDETYNGEKVRLLSCSTGSKENGFAQQLANALNTEVEAPNDILIAFPNGTFKVGYDGKGKMVTFKPGGGRKK